MDASIYTLQEKSVRLVVCSVGAEPISKTLLSLEIELIFRSVSLPFMVFAMPTRHNKSKWNFHHTGKNLGGKGLLACEDGKIAVTPPPSPLSIATESVEKIRRRRVTLTSTWLPKIRLESYLSSKHIVPSTTLIPTFITK